MELLDILRCPTTKLRLVAPSGDESKNLMPLWSPDAIEGGNITGLLVTEDHKIAYPIIDGVPALLPEFGRSVA